MNYLRQKKNNQLQYDSTVEDICSLINQFHKRSSMSQRALCCLLGSYAGDNLGNYNEFWKKIDENQIDEAMQMNGKGTHSLVPGQSTDDTELATSLGFGLIESQYLGVMNLDMIAKYYICWYNSQPFDMGNTTRLAFQVSKSLKINYETSYMDYIYDNFALQLKTSSYNNNTESQSNGGLMRIAPLIVYLCKMDNQEMIKKAVYEEQSLTHPNQTSLECSYIFTRACIQLIQTGDAKKTFDTINQYVENECTDLQIKKYWKNHVLCEQFTNAIDKEGFVFHAFTMAFIFLKQISQMNLSQLDKRQILYYYYIRKVIQQCGDSDTNAAICGTMLGSLLNLSEFPQDYLQKIIYCNLQDIKQTLLKHPRHNIYNPRNCIYLCYLLLEYGPNSEHPLLIYPQNIDELKKVKTNQQTSKIQEQLIQLNQQEKLQQLNVNAINLQEAQNQNYIQNQILQNNNLHQKDHKSNQMQVEDYKKQNLPSDAENNYQEQQAKKISIFPQTKQTSTWPVNQQQNLSYQNDSFQQEKQNQIEIKQKININIEGNYNQANNNAYYQKDHKSNQMQVEDYKKQNLQSDAENNYQQQQAQKISIFPQTKQISTWPVNQQQNLSYQNDSFQQEKQNQIEIKQKKNINIEGNYNQANNNANYQKDHKSNQMQVEDYKKQNLPSDVEKNYQQQQAQKISTFPQTRQTNTLPVYQNLSYQNYGFQQEKQNQIENKQKKSYNVEGNYNQANNITDQIIQNQQNQLNQNQNLAEKRAIQSLHHNPQNYTINQQQNLSYQNDSFQQEKQNQIEIKQKKSYNAEGNYNQANNITDQIIHNQQNQLNQYQYLAEKRDTQSLHNDQQNQIGLKNKSFNQEDKYQKEINKNKDQIDFYKNAYTEATNKQTQNSQQTYYQYQIQQTDTNNMNDQQIHKQQPQVQELKNQYLNNGSNNQDNIQSDMQLKSKIAQQNEQIFIQQQQQLTKPASNEYSPKKNIQIQQNQQKANEVNSNQPKFLSMQSNLLQAQQNGVQPSNLNQQQSQIRQNNFNMVSSKIQQYKSPIPSNYQYFKK
ncbi:hypothetical protein ABPG74_017467 [Tetrahymena malaccensis]